MRRRLSVSFLRWSEVSILRLCAQLGRELLEIDRGQELADRLGAHLGLELVGRILAQLLVLVLGEELALR